jgi:hypothetical protein
MGQIAKPTRYNRTITVDFHDETTYFALVPGFEDHSTRIVKLSRKSKRYMRVVRRVYLGLSSR